MYDYRCMVTGVSLKGADAALVLLEPVGDGFAPMAFAISGNYNRLGAIDGIDEDANTKLVLDFFLGRLAAGGLVIDDAEAPDGVGDIETLLGVIERCVTAGPDVVLNGKRVVYALVSLAIWNEIVRAAPPRSTGQVLLEELFREGSVGREIYAGKWSGLSRHLRELSALSRFLAENDIAWTPPDDPSQHYSDEMRQYLEEAQQRFQDTPQIIRGLRAYDNEVGDLLEDS
jgi:hypothetical protein